MTESNASGYRLQSITCNDNDSTGAVVDPHREHPGRGRRDRALHVRQHEAQRARSRSSSPAPRRSTTATRWTSSSPCAASATRRCTTSSVTDNRCAPVSATPVSKTGGDQDDVLEDGEVWTYTCTKTVPTHAVRRGRPAVQRRDRDRRGRAGQAGHRHRRALHGHRAPGRSRSRRPPDRQTAQVGDTISYKFDVTNPGDIGLDGDAQRPALRRRHPDRPAEGRRRQRQLARAGRAVALHLHAQGHGERPRPAAQHGPRDRRGPARRHRRHGGGRGLGLGRHRPAGSRQAGAAAAGGRRSRCSPPSSSPRARPAAARGCVARAAASTARSTPAVNGRQIRRVTFFVDGKRVAVRRARNGQRRFTARVTPGRLSLGVHRVTARVVFRSASRTRPRTLVLSFQRCARQAPSPRFTG